MSVTIYMPNGQTLQEYVDQQIQEGITKAITEGLTIERVYDQISITFNGQLISWDYLK